MSRGMEKDEHTCFICISLFVFLRLPSVDVCFWSLVVFGRLGSVHVPRCKPSRANLTQLAGALLVGADERD